MKMVEQFKRRILDLAICGKLVPQDPNDEPASVLLERIREEKAELVIRHCAGRDNRCMGGPRSCAAEGGFERTRRSVTIRI